MSHTNKKVELICEAASDRKAEDIVIMEMKQRSGLCDYFVLMSAPSTVRAKAIVDHIEETLENEDIRLIHKEGYQDAMWVLMDYGDVIAHIFYQDTRKYYNLENLWGDAKKRNFSKD